MAPALRAPGLARTRLMGVVVGDSFANWGVALKCATSDTFVTASELPSNDSALR